MNPNTGCSEPMLFIDQRFYYRFIITSHTASGSGSRGRVCLLFILVGGDSGTPPEAAVTTLGYCPHPSSTLESHLVKQRMCEVHFSSAVVVEGPVHCSSSVEVSICRVGLGFGLGGPGVLRKVSSCSGFVKVKILMALESRRRMQVHHYITYCIWKWKSGKSVSTFYTCGQRFRWRLGMREAHFAPEVVW
ncbi:uncharacterized protein LOC132709289 isoform X2 [Pantherophis guttatus]|uniref:Uncharacterized protein LOC132709289 isoform X2 n=1 Tax=Pantherophis guttatus TaxID=94885 RepID=A0ABM3YR25_PANGU|nr:uncharacterized protein LOC132709289 isoform X2 [Pantherophis guttatus]